MISLSKVELELGRVGNDLIKVSAGLYGQGREGRQGSLSLSRSLPVDIVVGL